MFEGGTATFPGMLILSGRDPDNRRNKDVGKNNSNLRSNRAEVFVYGVIK